MTATGSAAAQEKGARKRYVLAWLALLLASVLFAALPSLVTLPELRAGMRFTTAEFQEDAGAGHTVALPYTWSPAPSENRTSATYRVTFDGQSVAARPVVIFIPTVRQRIELWLNGAPIYASSGNSWDSLRSGYYYMNTLPNVLIRPGPNVLELRQSRMNDWSSGYLSQIYLAPRDAVLPFLRIHDFVVEQWRAMSFALQILLATSVLVILLMRRHDAVYRWLSLMISVSLAMVVLQSPLMVALGDLRIYFSVTQVAVGMLAIAVALAVMERPRPAALFAAILGAPLFLLAMALLNVVPVPLVVFISGGLAVMALLVAALILGEHFARTRNWMAAMLAVPFGLTGWFGVHDICLALGLIDGTVMLVPYSRLLVLLALMALLTGQLVQSLNRLDVVHETLTQRLAEQETELKRLYEKERARASQRVLERERERLMRDLHDGLSGHLVSILAQSEKPETDGPAIHQSAREALDDLRLVVQSLDLGEGDLRVALAGFRERLEPQLRRQGVALEWSMVALPEVAGMTPGHALAILRILQEAVTNALKHGPARRIGILGQLAPDGGAVLTVMNDGAGISVENGSPGQGNGLTNMRRRARSFGGEAIFEVLQPGACLTLHLPGHLGRAFEVPHGKAPG